MKTIKVVAAIIKRNNQILIAKRSYGDYAGLWEFPGGKIENNETSKNALIREIKEELEIDINIDEYLTCVEYDYPNFHLSMECFICSLDNDTIQLHDHSTIKWIDINDDIKNINWVPADVLVVKAIKKYYL